MSASSLPDTKGLAASKSATVTVDAKPQLEVSTDQGKLVNQVLTPNPETGGWRISFELAPQGAKAVELRARIKLDDAPLTETWTYRWTP